jgi:hypothetical protein
MQKEQTNPKTKLDELLEKITPKNIHPQAC